MKLPGFCQILQLFKSNVIDAEIKSVTVAPEYRNANGLMHIISKDGDVSDDKIILLGGYTSYSECDLEPEYGGCRLMHMMPTTITSLFFILNIFF